jgi:putative addiction module killer protein
LPEAIVRKKIFFRDADGSEPVKDWLDELKRKKRFVEFSKISTCIDRASQGNFGKHRILKAGIGELKIDYGPGYRVYFGIEGDEWIVLLKGGSKESQEADIESASKRWDLYLKAKEKSDEK